MKKIHYFYCGIVELFSSVLKIMNYSSESNTVNLLKMRISIGIDGIQYTEKFQYKGKKLISVTGEDGSVSKYYYKGNVIAQIDELDKKGKICCTTKFIYAKGKVLYRIIKIPGAAYNNQIRYDHDENGSISYDLVMLNALSGEEYKKVKSGKIKFKDGNLQKNESLNEGSDSLELYSYDTNRNPLQNVLGIDLLLDYASVNNLLNKTVISRNDEGCYFMSTTTCSYKYNENNYPIEKNEIFENGNYVSNVITRYIY